MSSIGPWEPDRGLPETLEGLLKETEINNSFDNEKMTDELIDSMQSSYAYLYRFQEVATHFKRFHYQTRDYLLNTTYSEIQDGLTKYWNILGQLETDPVRNEEEIKKVKRIIAEFTEVRYGDLYVDGARRICCELDYNIILPGMRDAYRQSSLFGKALTPMDIVEHKNMFIEFPVVLVDHEVHTNILILPHDKSTTVIFKDMTALDLYTKENQTQIFHDLCFMFIENSYYGTFTFTADVGGTFVGGTTRIPLDKVYNSRLLKEVLKGRSGSFFVSVNLTDKKHKSTLLEATVHDNYLEVALDAKTRNYIATEKKSVVYDIFFMKGLYSYNYYGDPSGLVTMKTIWVEEGEGHYVEKPVSPFFIPCKKDDEPFSMPIHPSNIIIFKSLTTDTGLEYRAPVYQCGTTIHYPNMYRIKDDTLTKTDSYKVYYFYREEDDKKYTPLFNFYHDFLAKKYDITFEAALNLVYFKEWGWNKFGNGIFTNQQEDVFYDIITKIIEYKDYEYFYGTPDFECFYVGDREIPRKYKCARMREFIRADYHVLEKYVKREKNTGRLYHFFTNTVNISGRKRRSTRLENPSDPYLFAANVARCGASETGAFKVSNSQSYNFDTEVYIDDVKIEIPDIKAGEYVKFTNLTNRYVFAFRNDDTMNSLPLRIFVDGLWISDIERVHKLGMDYLYIPMDVVTDDSYILIERDFYMAEPVNVQVTAPSQTDWVTVHFVETPLIQYTMNDVYVTDINGDKIDPSLYTTKIVKNGVYYSMTDERHGKTNRFGVVTDIAIQFTNVDFNYGTTFFVNVNKSAYLSVNKASRNGYPKFKLEGLNPVDELSFVRMFYNGRKVPNELYKLGMEDGEYYVQSRILCKKGDVFIFEISPYTRNLVYSQERIPDNYVIDFTKLLNKPVNPEYYEVYVNGRRLGHPNIFEFGPHHGVFRGLHSNYKLEIYEKERDYEYFGYEAINIVKENETQEYYFTPMDLIESGTMTSDEIKALIDAYIESVKDPHAIIKPNVIDEEENIYHEAYNILEDIQIFYYEELLPVGLANPDKVQFNKDYLFEMYPWLFDRYMQTNDDGDDVIFLNPDLANRSFYKNFDSYEMIDPDEMDKETTLVYLMGENDINTGDES